MKAVWKGFGRSIKLKEFFSDLIFQNFCSKTAEIGNFFRAIYFRARISGVGARLWPTPPERAHRDTHFGGFPTLNDHQKPVNRPHSPPKCVGYAGFGRFRSGEPILGDVDTASGKSAPLRSSSVKLKIITRLRNRPISSKTHRMVLRSEAANRLHSWCWCSQNSTESWPSL